MANQVYKRSVNTPMGYRQQPPGTVNLYDQTYVGFVKQVEDTSFMGRLKVWIPELNQHPEDPKSWITVQYCSPFAGATPAIPGDIVKNSTALAGTQQSYGWWGVPPHLENEVVVQFINGDPNRGIWIGCLYQQNINNMTPGLPSSPSFQSGGPDGEHPPVAEVNKWGSQATNVNNPVRPQFTPLHNSLLNQGLYSDDQRGPSTSGARRESPSQVYGMKTPAGFTWTFDELEGNQCFRLRTPNGVQLLLNDTIGYFYVTTRNGNSWLEVSDDGIFAYTAKDYNVRAQNNFNLHVDGNYNCFVAGNSSTFIGGNQSISIDGTLDLLSTGKQHFQTAAALHLNVGTNCNLQTGTDHNIKVGGAINQASTGALSVTSSGEIKMQGTQIIQNNGAGTQPAAAEAAVAITLQHVFDKQVNPASNYPDIETQTNVSTLVTHEPHAAHPAKATLPPTIPLNTKFQNNVQIDGNAPPPTNTVVPQPVTPPPVVPDNGTYVVPTTGRITSPFGPRYAPTAGASSFHRGIDIANRVGTPIIASRAGTVTQAGVSGGYGNLIIIDHGDGYTTRYGHLSGFISKEGDVVQQGQQIGLMGSTGVSTGPHLHFEIRQNQVAINPATLLTQLSAAVGSTVTAGASSMLAAK